MATLLPRFDNSPQIEGMRMQANLLQSLGKQVRETVQTIQTQRQLQTFAQGIKNVDPASPDFNRQVVGLMASTPMAMSTPIAKAAISQLGAEHALWRREQAQEDAFGRQLGLLAVKNYERNKPYGSGPTTRQEYENIATGQNPEPSLPGETPAQPTLNEDPYGDKQFLNEGTPSIPPAGGAPPIPPGPANLFGDAGMPSTAPIDNVGAKLKAFQEGLVRQKVPQHLAEGMLRDYTRSLTPRSGSAGISKRPLADGTGEILIDNQGNTTVVKYPEGARTGTAVNVEADNRRADAARRMQEANMFQSRAETIRKQMENTGIGEPGPFFEDDKWYRNTTKGKEEVNKTVAKQWLDLNDEYSKAQKAARAAEEAYSSIMGGASAAATAVAPATDVVVVIDPNGRRGKIPRSKLEAALAAGYKQE
jgi:hypothetical protein